MGGLRSVALGVSAIVLLSASAIGASDGVREP
ncbi:MAG: hypothetical protein RL685_1502, partial [Pseudomonadota bacterium]